MRVEELLGPLDGNGRGVVRAGVSLLADRVISMESRKITWLISEWEQPGSESMNKII